MKNRFTLTRQNQKGQVALFVALIFQVVFIFFALLINVGLLVHHKINLQQSTDIAAYYGAMKQAEILNAISHVNFQMRQAWKLLTWRYRIFGTFGLQTADPYQLQLPMLLQPNNGKVDIRYNVAESENRQCTIGGQRVDIADIPFFCVGHNGIQGWNPNQGSSETFCKVTCGNLNQIATDISAIPLTGGSSIPFGGSVGASANTAINNANNTISSNCDGVGPKSVGTLAMLIASYFNDVQKRKELIQILGSNLSLPGNQIMDIEGKKIFDGAKKTFLNNLTEANQLSNSVFDVYNSLDRSKNSGCSFSGDKTDGSETSIQFLKEIKIKFVQYFIQSCVSASSTGVISSTKPYSIFNSDFSGLEPSLRTALLQYHQNNQAVVQQIEQTLVASNYLLGYEKNPWCQVYVATKAETKPKIPFLPLSTITLSAVSVAKPFGGTVGPWYGQTWASGNPSSTGTKTESVLPLKEVASGSNLGTLSSAKEILLNYSNYLGDQVGLADKKLIAAYHSMLMHRSVKPDITSLSFGKENPSESIDFVGPANWPSFSSWNNGKDIDSGSYDYVATSSSGNQNSGLRDIELSVIAPSQFDLANYSIDADYYNNYYLKLKASISTIQNSAASGISFDAKFLRPDYGDNDNLSGIAKGFSVRHQIQVASQIIKETGFYNSDGAGSVQFKDIFRFLPDRMSTLLTGWTFAEFNNYRSFPNQPLGDEYTMTFGRCADEWHNNPKSFASPAGTGTSLPPAPGNCVTGGRVGYSVKLVSPNMVRAGNPQTIGGSTGEIANPIDTSFLQF